MNHPSDSPERSLRSVALDVVPADGAPARPAKTGPLATLPVFLDLAGREALVAGGTAAAAWKAELLAAAGAHVLLLAPLFELGEEARELLTCGPAAGRIDYADERWSAERFAGMAIAVCDADSEDEAEAFAAESRRHGVPVNVIGRPRWCDFRFGSIVNRSPVVIGISTDGAAPILGQAIRRRIETLLPPALAGWARLAAKLRPDVLKNLAHGGRRAAFWDRFADRTFSAHTPDAGDETDARRLLDALSRSPAAGGSVTLVGAGPGEAELLTLKAVRALQAADVILFDDLVSDDVLELARREARRLLVGKRAERESHRQEDINALMIQLAQAGRHVVRLKSGDVSVFGRAGEEIAALEAAGIEVRIVPGITAASALAAGFGISLTHRDCARELRFVTGHSRKGRLPEDLDWRALADPCATTIYYMGGRVAGQIAEQLIRHGLPPETPVAVAANVSRPDETRAAGRLDTLADVVASVGLDRPILIGIGRVFEQAARRASSSDSSPSDRMKADASIQ
ncbi:siroheme synthase CysG [Consotaella salsifontis]|uniref:Uroporphyrin-III C-methyltransferase / precorrin-2 dehydrogenase / sirohydrochlorin ferrochelatase n=1 Tax=Consotaella salsifontis TaxID=1365950 RepID=A0A1T4SJ26_9HYPH|nr:siroheme synthase CysG [Consotaella salsifontis]SKA28187.1 uroporphyrin-III C-methyltransferase / precorrin-2 dehydrogenase / sirohydrochlorin ferrochelatase [Consotaella salsifontis]